MIHVVHLADVPAQPWKNGGGTTRELLGWPSAEDWLVRVSVARIDRDGPFSAYSGVRRWFTVLAGDGVQLRWKRMQTIMTAGSQPTDFDGADPPDCSLMGGPTEDLNLMLKPSHAHGKMLCAIPGKPRYAAAGWRGVYTVQPCQYRGREVLDLPAHTLLWDDDAPARGWELKGDASVLAWWIEIPKDPAELEPR